VTPSGWNKSVCASAPSNAHSTRCTDEGSGNRRGGCVGSKITVKDGSTEWTVWDRGTALLLPRCLKGRQTGPLFCCLGLLGP